MYTEYYNLSEEPFKLSPDSRFFFPSTVHARAKAYLAYGLQQSEGFTVITGEVGAGKTTLVNLLLNSLSQNDFTIGNVVTTNLSADDMLRMVASVFNISYEGSEKTVILDRIYNFLKQETDAGKRCLLIVDEAQNLTFQALEELRMLSNFQHGGKAGLQFCLLGQPQFRKTMSHPDLEQFRQRTIASFHLSGLDHHETSLYVKHRLAAVEWKDDPSLTEDCLEEIFKHTSGIPRKINVLCSRLFLLGELEELHELDGKHVLIVAEDLAQETAAISDLPCNADTSENPTATNSRNSSQLATTSSRAAELPAHSGDTASELAYLIDRLERLENQARQDKDKIVKFVADELKSMSENLSKLQG